MAFAAMPSVLPADTCFLPPSNPTRNHTQHPTHNHLHPRRFLDQSTNQPHAHTTCLAHPATHQCGLHLAALARALGLDARLLLVQHRVQRHEQGVDVCAASRTRTHAVPNTSRPNPTPTLHPFTPYPSHVPMCAWVGDGQLISQVTSARQLRGRPTEITPPSLPVQRTQQATSACLCRRRQPESHTSSRLALHSSHL